MNISNTVKAEYKRNAHAKIVTVNFPELNYTVPRDEVYYESLTLDEAIFDSNSFEVVGCIASQLQIEIRDTQLELKGKKITVSIALEGVNGSTIPLFYGYVDSVDRQAQQKKQKILAYDALYSKGATDVASWYNNLSFPISIYNFRNSLFSYIGVTQEDVALPNDSVYINKEYNPNTITALNIIKAICQINGCFGKMTRTGTFNYLFLDTEATAETVDYYRSMDYKDYVVNPIDKLTIRQSTDDSGVTIGTGDNKYIIQGNMFTYNKSVNDIFAMATNIYVFLKDIAYVPFDASNDGYPWIEVGDNCVLQYSVYDFDNSSGTTDVYKDVTVVVMKRTLKGIQNLVDNYNAQGQELQREFVSDVSADLSVLQQTVEELKQRMDTEITTYRNPNAITIGNGNTVDVADLTYTANEGNTIIFHEEIDLIATAAESEANDVYTEPDILATIYYYVNGYRMPDHISEGLLREGKNILHLMQFWEAGQADINRVQAKMTITGGSISIPKIQAQAYITVKQSDYNDFMIQLADNCVYKQIYEPNDLLNYNGVIILKKYFDESTPSVDITSLCTFDPPEWTRVTYEQLQEGQIEINVSYSEVNEIGEIKTYYTQFYVAPQYITGLSIDKDPKKNTYFVGETLNLNGIKVVADYLDGTTRDVTNLCTYSPNTGATLSTVGSQTITATYTEDGVTVTAETSVYVQAIELTQIKVTNPPNKRSYKVGETLDYTGMRVTAYYNNNTSANITNQCTYNPANGSTVTANTSTSIDIGYGTAASTSFDGLTIITFDGITVSAPQLRFEAGDTISYSGVSVTGNWSDGSTEDVTSDCEFYPDNGSTASMDETSVTVEYTNYTYSQTPFTDTFNIDVYEFTGIEIKTEPTITEYWLGDTTDYSGIVVVGTYSDGTEDDVTASCTFMPVNGAQLTSVGTANIRVTYVRPKTGLSYFATFSVEVKEPESVIKYLNYTRDDVNRIIYVYGLNGSEIAEDNLHNLVIPSSYTDEETGITYRMVLGRK